LSPTFKLRVGLPGRSNAFDISRKLGLPERVVARAAESMDSGSIAFETVIEQAEANRQAADAARADAERELAEIEDRREALDREIRKIEDEKAAVIEKARNEALEKIAEVDEYAEIVRAELKGLLDEAGSLIDGAKTGSVASGDAKKTPSRGDFYRRLDENRKAIRRLDEEFRGMGKGGAKDRKSRASGRSGEKPVAGDLRVGDAVRLVSLGAEGEVATLPDDKGELQILVGRVRMTVPLADLRVVKGAKTAPRGGYGGARKGRGSSGGMAHIRLDKANTVSSSIDVHGFTLDDAIIEVDKYIEDAMLAGYHEVVVVHGRGEGILRSGLRRMLTRHKHVRKVRQAGPDEGGDGATVVTLK
jgi:DNA mismatch repair protein MutS2